jgi:hypothetical protein
MSLNPKSNSSNFSVKKKKIEIEHNHQNKKYYIIIFNILLIFIAIFCLIFENNLNRELKGKFMLYMDVFIFNRFILNLMTSYIALLNICDENLNCHNYIEEYFNQYEKFSQLDTFLYNELSIKMEEITNSFDSLNKRIKNSNEIKIKKYLEINEISNEFDIISKKFTLEEKRKMVADEMAKYKENENLEKGYLDYIKNIIKDNTNTTLLTKYLLFLKKNEVQLAERFQKNFESFHDEINQFQVCFIELILKEKFNYTKSNSEKNNLLYF